jgi:hypothetical protein
MEISKIALNNDIMPEEIQGQSNSSIIKSWKIQRILKATLISKSHETLTIFEKKVIAKSNIPIPQNEH